jgi:prephenate dehydrogenase
MNKLVIFGVGLIGGSLALALKQSNANVRIVGVGRNPDSLSEALRLNIIDQAEIDVKAALSNADVIVLAAPVAQTQPILTNIKPLITPNMVITDAGSTKCDVLNYANSILGEQFCQFVGGHPIAGAEKSGPSAAMANLYQNKNVILTPANQTNSNAINVVKSMWEQCGAIVSTMPAETHDGIFAAVSHLPHLLAFALVDDLASRPNAEQLFSFAASGFRDFTRIAGSHPEMWRDISFANKAALLNEIQAFQTELETIKQLLQDENSTALEALFLRASQARNQWAKTKQAQISQ